MMILCYGKRFSKSTGTTSSGVFQCSFSSPPIFCSAQDVAPAAHHGPLDLASAAGDEGDEKTPVFSQWVLAGENGGDFYAILFGRCGKQLMLSFGNTSTCFSRIIEHVVDCVVS